VHKKRKKMIDAEFRSEERFSRLALAYKGDEEKKRVNACIDSVTAKYSLKPEVHSTAISNGREVTVIEYHDDMDREAGEIFEEIIKTLDIKVCD
jgi:intracellular sulfur oxidation DsrE/DsrF family protein